MKEAEFWSSRLKPRLIRECQAVKLRHHFERVENRVADGTPDVDYIIGGVAGKLELKFAPTPPLSPRAQVLGKGHGLRRSQIIYAARYTWAGGLLWCLVGTPDDTWVIDLRGMTPERMDTIATAGRADLDLMAAWRGRSDAWSALIEILSKP